MKIILFVLVAMTLNTSIAGTKCDQADILNKAEAVAIAMADSSDRATGSLVQKTLEVKPYYGSGKIYEVFYKAGKLWVTVNAVSFGTAQNPGCNVTSAQLGVSP